MFGLSRATRAAKKSVDQKMEELRASILKQGTNERSSEESQKAIAYCEWSIHQYEDWFEYNEDRWYMWQQVTIIAGVIATLAGAIPFPESLQPWSWIRGIPAAVATIGASYLGGFSFREDAVRYELAANALWNELIKYQARAEPYNKDEAADTSLFLKHVCGLVESELNSWSTLARGNADVENNQSRKPPTTGPGS
jgi:hypothetical protein